MRPGPLHLHHAVADNDLDLRFLLVVMLQWASGHGQQTTSGCGLDVIRAIITTSSCIRSAFALSIQRECCNLGFAWVCHRSVWFISFCGKRGGACTAACCCLVRPSGIVPVKFEGANLLLLMAMPLKTRRAAKDPTLWACKPAFLYGRFGMCLQNVVLFSMFNRPGLDDMTMFPIAVLQAGSVMLPSYLASGKFACFETWSTSSLVRLPQAESRLPHATCRYYVHTNTKICTHICIYIYISYICYPPIDPWIFGC